MSTPFAAAERRAGEGRRPTMAIWTVDREFDQPIRHGSQTSSADSIAIFTLRLAPDLGEPSVRFVDAVSDDEAAHWVPYIEEGVRLFVEASAAQGRPIGYLRVTLVAITIHPIDTQSYRFRQAGE